MLHTTEHQQEKADLRRNFLKARESLPPEAWTQKSDRLISHLQTSHLFTCAETILAYFSFRQEPNLSPLFSDDHKWGFPRIQGKSLSWHSWQPGESLQQGKYGIFEPHPDSPTLQPDQVDLILVPAVACDYRGYRLGYGGGFYDRMLSSVEWASKPTIGIVFEEAYLPQLPIDDWDKPLQGVCTESSLKIDLLNLMILPQFTFSKFSRRGHCPRRSNHLLASKHLVRQIQLLYYDVAITMSSIFFKIKIYFITQK
jgi:5-formyltetrahydrofolate cyclo-ligase